MKKVDFTRLNSANVAVENSVDSERKYDIKCNANISNGELNSIDSGFVVADDVQVATFSMYGGNVNTTYNNITKEEKCAVIYAVDDFIADVKNEIETNPIQV